MERKDHGKQANDYRDCVRLAKVAASIVTGNGETWNRLPPRGQPAPRRNTVLNAGDTFPDGRPWNA